MHVNELGYYWTGPDEFNPNTGHPLVREKSGIFYFSSRSVKSQGILQNVQGNFKYEEKSGKFLILAQTC